MARLNIKISFLYDMSGKVEIIGTSHIAKESIEKLTAKIDKEKPGLVTVELDKLRYAELMKSHRRPRRVRITDIRRMGFFGWMFAVIGAFAQRRLGQKAGAQPGSDMKAAILAAKKAGSQVALIDRDIAETVYRLSKEVPLREKLYLGWFIFFGWIFARKDMERLNKLDLKKVPSDRVIHELIYDFRHKFPNMYRVLVTERDHHMAARVKMLHQMFPDQNILVVVGAGHVEGITKLLKARKK